MTDPTQASSPECQTPLAEAADLVLPDLPSQPPQPPQIVSDDDIEAQQAIEIANSARQQWNAKNQAEVQQSRQFSRMADELSTAILDHLRTVPRPVAVMVGRKVYEGTR